MPLLGGHGSHAQQAWKEKPQSIAWQGQALGWGLKDLLLRTTRQVIHRWITSGCILTQNKLFKKETHSKSSVFIAGKLCIRYTDTIIKQSRKWLLGRGQESRERVRRRDFILPAVKPSDKRTKTLGGGGKEGHGRESRSLSYISADKGCANTDYCPKPRKTWAHNGRVIRLSFSVTSVNTNTQSNHLQVSSSSTVIRC